MASPTRISRLREKQDLQQLNDRLAVYIERVRALELENSRLQGKVSDKDKSTAREISNLKCLYEAELADVRRILDETAKDRAQLQIELGKAESELEEACKSLKRKDSELSAAISRNAALEGHLNTSETSLSTIRSQNAVLLSENQDLKTFLAKAKDGHAVAKRQLEAETLMRVDLENRCQSLSEEIDFQKTVHDQELQESRRVHESVTQELNLGVRQEYESKLANALQELRQQHQEQVAVYREDLQNTFQSKLQNARSSTQLNDQAAAALREELLEAQTRVQNLALQLDSVQKLLIQSEDRTRELEAALASERERQRRLLEEKETALNEIRDKMDSHINEYQELLDVKLALDMEIHAYRKLLEGEETRLKLSPSPTSQEDVTQLASATILHKRRRVEVGFHDEESSSGISGGISIAPTDLEGNYVTVVNMSDQDCPLGNWRLNRQVDEQDVVSYKFSPRFVLGGGRAVTVWSADSGSTHRPPTDLLWKSQSSWGTGRDIITLLLDADGQEVSRRTVSPSEDDGDDVIEEEEHEETHTVTPLSLLYHSFIFIVHKRFLSCNMKLFHQEATASRECVVM